MNRTVLLFAAAVLLLLVVPPRAQSQEYGQWEVRFVGHHPDGRPQYARVYCRTNGTCVRPKRYARTRDNGTRVYGYVRRESEDYGSCREIRRVVGDQHLTVDGAKKAANDAWAGAVRFHLGEKFMDLNNARNISYTCSRSSIKEGGVTTLGQTFTRCEVEAQPCHPPRQQEANDK